MNIDNITRLRIRILTPSLDDGIGMSVTYNSLMLASLCDVQVGVLFISDKQNKILLEEAGVKVVDLKGRHGIDLLSVLRAFRWAQKSGVDVVQVPQASTYPHAWVIARLLKVVMVVFLCTPISSFEGLYPRIHLASRFIFPRADYIVCISQYIRSKLLKYYPAQAKSSCAIHSPINPRSFVPPEFRPPNAVGVVVTMIPVKKLDRLIKAWPHVVRQYPKATLDFYGDGPERSRLEKLAQELGLGSEVCFHGYVSDVRDAFSRIGIFVLPTEGESYGQAFVEAMLMGRPCIAVDSGGVPEIILDEETGLLVPPGDEPVSLAEAIIYLLENPAQADAMGRAGRKRALSHFTPDVLRDTYMSLYFNLLENH